MATKKIEFELTLQTKAVDGAVIGVNKQIVSISSNLKDSISKIEVLKKDLETTGTKLPALSSLKLLREELSKAGKSVKHIQDESLKTALTNYLEGVKKIKLAPALGGLVAPGKQASLSDLTPTKLKLIENAYNANVLKGKQESSPAVLKELEAVLKRTNLTLSQAKQDKNVDISKVLTDYVNAQTKALKSSMTLVLTDYLLKQKQQSKQDEGYNSAFNGKNLTNILSNFYKNSQSNQQSSARQQQSPAQRLVDNYDRRLDSLVKGVAAFKPINPYQNPIQKQFEDNLAKFSSWDNAKGLNKLGKTAVKTNLTLLESEQALYNKHKPLTFVQEQQTLIKSLRQQLTQIPSSGVLADLWSKVAIEINAAERALEKYIATEKSLKFQSGLLKAQQTLGQKTLTDLPNQTKLKSSNLSNIDRLAIEQEDLLKKINKRYKNLIDNTVKNLTPASTQEERKLASTKIKELGNKASSELSRAGELNNSRLIAASLKDELETLKQQNKEKLTLKQRTEEVNKELRKVSLSNLSASNKNKLLQELNEAKKVLLEINNIQKKIVSESLLNQNQKNYGLNSLNSAEQKRQLEIVQGKYGQQSLQAINLLEQQQLQALREKTERRIGKANNLITDTSSSSDRARHKTIIDAITQAYNKQSEAIVRNSAASRANSAIIQAHLRAHTNFLVKISEFVVGYRLINQILDSTVRFIQNIPESGIRLENVNAVFTAMFVKTKDVANQFTFLDTVVDKTGGRLKILRTEFGDYAASAKAAGESTANIQKSFADLAETSTVLHLPEEKVHGALVAISQMYAKNQVMAEELKRQLGNVLPGAVAIFARSQNMTSRELLDAMKIGAIKPKEAVPQFLSYYKNVFAPQDAFDKASKGLYSNLGRLENEYTRTSEQIYTKSSESLIGFVKGATEGLKELRSNLDGILTVLKDIAIVGAVAGASSLFSVGRNALARSALGVANLRRAEASVNLRRSSIIPRQLNATNPDDLAPFLLLSRLPTNGLTVLRNAISNIHPAAKLAIAGIIALETGIKTLENVKIDIGEGVSLSGFDIIKIKLAILTKDLEAWSKKSWVAKIGIVETSETGQVLTKLTENIQTAFDNVEKINQEREAKLQQNGILGYGSRAQLPSLKQFLSSLLTEEEKAAAREKEVLSKRETAYREFKENLQQEAQKRLLNEPDNLLENAFDSKSFTRTIELVGRAVTTQISLISELANAEVQKIELGLAKLDRKARLGLISQGDVLQAKLQAVEQERAIRNEQTNKKLELNLKPIELNRQFSFRNEATATLEKTLTAAKESYEKLLKIQEGMLVLNIRNKEGAVEQVTKTGLGYVAQTDANGNPLLTSKELEAKSKQVSANREEVLRLLSAPENKDLNPGLKPSFVGQDTIIFDSQIKKAGEAVDKFAKQLLDTREALQKTAIDYETFFQKEEYGNLSDKQVKTLTSALPRLEQYKPLIDAAAKKYAIPAELIKSVIVQESVGVNDAKSKAGAAGLMQLMPGTAKQYGVRDRYDPAQSIEAGAHYLSDLYYKDPVTKGSLPKTIAAYNFGQGNIGKVVDDLNNPTKVNKKQIPEETLNYNQGVFRYFSALTNNLNQLQEGLDASQKLDKKDRIAGKAAVSRGFTASEAMAGAELENLQINNQLDLKIQNLIDEFDMAKLELRQSFTQQITEPFNRLARPNSSENLKNELQSQYQLTFRQLESELKTKNPEQRILTDKEVNSLKASLKGIIDLQVEIFNREKARSIFQAKSDIIVTKRQNLEATYDFQAEAPITQILKRKEFVLNELNLVKENRNNELERIKQDTGLSYLESNKERLLKEIDSSSASSDVKQNKKNALLGEIDTAKLKTEAGITQYDTRIQDLTEQSKEFSNYWRTNITESMREPLKAFLLDWDNAGESLKSFGRNLLGTIADNITQDLANNISKLVVEAGNAENSGSGWLGTIIKAGFNLFSGTGTSTSARAGGFIDGYKQGGDTSEKPKVYTKTSRVKGAGTGTSDSVRAIVRKGSYIFSAETAKQVNLSNGEIVIDPETTQAIGKEQLDRINFGGNFAKGGSVDGRTPVINNAVNSVNNPLTNLANQYNITIVVEGGKTPEDDGKKAALEFVKVIAKTEATQAAIKYVSQHEKRRHKTN